jgi:type I site-specific restriction endonuclease
MAPNTEADNGRFDKTIVFCVDQEHAEDKLFTCNT